MGRTMGSNPVEDEISTIRIKLHEQTKDMTAEEQIEFFHRMAQDGLARPGVTARRAEASVQRQQVGQLARKAPKEREKL